MELSVAGKRICGEYQPGGSAVSGDDAQGGGEEDCRLGKGRVEVASISPVEGALGAAASCGEGLGNVVARGRPGNRVKITKAYDKKFSFGTSYGRGTGYRQQAELNDRRISQLERFDRMALGEIKEKP